MKERREGERMEGGMGEGVGEGLHASLVMQGRERERARKRAWEKACTRSIGQVHHETRQARLDKCIRGEKREVRSGERMEEGMEHA